MFLGGALSEWIFAFVCYGGPRARPFKLYQLRTCEPLLEPGPAECAKHRQKSIAPQQRSSGQRAWAWEGVRKREPKPMENVVA